MPDPIPADDLYARLGVPSQADTPAIDRAWRALLKRHHPDVAGSVSLNLAKLINVAHDWLSHPERRARYDAAIRRREGRRAPVRAHPVDQAARPTRQAPQPRPTAPPPDDDLDETFAATAATVRSFLAQASALSPDDIDRLSVSEPDGSVGALRRVVPPDLWARVAALDARLAGVLPPGVMADPAGRTAARAYGAALVLELFLWYYLADAEPLLERMRRGWESAVGLPRYGPNTDEVRALIRRLAAATAEEAAALAAAWDRLGDREPWPADAREFDFAAFEVSTALARRDGAAALGPAALGPAAVPSSNGRDAGLQVRIQAAYAPTAHVVTLRPILPPRAYARYQRAWAAIGVPASRQETGNPAAGPTVRRRA